MMIDVQIQNILNFRNNSQKCSEGPPPSRAILPWLHHWRKACAGAPCTYTYTHTHTHTHTHTTHTHAHTHMHIHTRTHAHMHTCTHAHTYHMSLHIALLQSGRISFADVLGVTPGCGPYPISCDAWVWSVP